MCFPKFDLRPSGYGCQDPMYYNAIRDKLGISYQGHCVEPPYNACQIRQPYTTYGYIRNLCGSKQNSRIDVLKSLKDKQPDGGYTDVSGSGDIVEPMYVNFLRPLDDTKLGFPVDGSDPFLDVLPPSTGVGDEDGDGIPDNSGVRVNRPYWGLTDDQGRLAFPYFHTKLAKGVQPCPPPEGPPTLYDYIAYDTRTTITDGWPTDAVPFLIEIDHEDYCVGCATNQIDDKQYSITIESLPASYFHGTRDINNEGLLEGRQDINSHKFYGFKYGFNYCKYPGINSIPDWRIGDDGNEGWFVPTGCNGAFVSDGGTTYTPSLPHVGETCGCLSSTGITIPLRRHQLLGTDMPKYYSTDGGTNSYTAFPSGCSEPRPDPYRTPVESWGIMNDYTVYFAAFVHCSSIDNVVPSVDSNNNRTYGNLSTLFNCGACSHSYPATNSKPNLSLDFWYVGKRFISWFEGFTDKELTTPAIVDFLRIGAQVGFVGVWDTVEGVSNVPHPYPINIATLPQGICGAGYKEVLGDCYPYPTNAPCTLGTSNWEYAANYGFDASPATNNQTCYAYRSGSVRTIKLDTNIPGCIGSTITLYGYSYFNTPEYTIGTDGGFNRGTPWMGAIGTSGCCSTDCFAGENADEYNIPAFKKYSSIAAYNAAQSCINGNDLKNAGLGPCGSILEAQGCYNKVEGACCRTDMALFNENGMKIDRPLWPDHCYARGLEDSDEAGTFSWREANGGCPEGYYGELKASHAHLVFSTVGLSSSFLTSWSGTNIPGAGNVNKMPLGLSMAIRVNGHLGYEQNAVITNPIAGVSTCNYDSGPNNTTLVASEFARVTRTNKRAGYTHQYMHMGPVECTKTLAGSEVGATCVRPIYPNTMASISAGGTGITRVAVNKETFHPEIMTVHKIECVNGVYALHVSREYYEHDRKAYAYQVKAEGIPPLPSISKYPIYGKLEGGRDGIAYHSPPILDATINVSYYFELCDTSNTGVIFSNQNNETTVSAAHPDGKWDYPIIIPMMSRADYISPCYDDSGCVRADEPFNKSLCVSYYDINSYEGGSGTGASGYFQSDSEGVLSFVISNSGAGYFYEDESGVLVSCARAIFDNPCVGLTLGVDTGIYSSHAVTGYAINYSACSDNWPECCEDLSGGDKKDCREENPNGPHKFCYDIVFPNNKTWPVTIIGCDAVPKIRCDGITIQTCPNRDPKYPNFYNAGSGTSLWNYYNLVYDQENPDARFLSDAGLVGAVFFPPTDDGPPRPFPTNEVIVTANNVYTGFVNGSLIGSRGPLGTDATDFTCSYSCIRDNANCGGEFFTNKEFLPRRKYATGTKVTRYGPLSICAQTAERSWGNWLHGHVDLSSSIIDTKEMGGLDDVRYVPLVDPSKAGAYTMLTEPVGLADDIIYVAELTTLLGAKHPFFKMLEPQSLDNKSCIMPDSGCFNFLPIHNASTANGISETRFFSGEDVYYTDGDIIRTAISNGLVGTSGCLLNPFKIMVDVEPCGERLGHVGTSDPMNLSWVVGGVNAGVCRGWLYGAVAGCGGTSCDNKIEAFGSEILFPSTKHQFWKCSGGYLENDFCSHDEISQGDCNSAPDTIGACPEATYIEYFTWTGRDGKEYIHTGDNGPLPTNFWFPGNPCNVMKGQWINLSCLEGGPANLPLDPSCTPIGECTERLSCINPVVDPPKPPITHKYIINKVPRSNIAPQGGPFSEERVAGEADHFCDMINNSTDYLRWKSALGARCFTTNAENYPGPFYAAGYRDVNLKTGDERCALLLEIHKQYECLSGSTVEVCPFPSVLKITITEAS